MPRGLDHIVHAVRDLEGAAELYRRLGFTVGARNRHSWGTHNHLVQLPGFFHRTAHRGGAGKLGCDGFSKLFGRFNQSFPVEPGRTVAVDSESGDAMADAATFHSAGVAVSDVMRFEREGKRPDGAPVKVAFSLAFARDAGAPAIGFAVCQQHFPENFWNPAFQQHPNTATGIASRCSCRGKSHRPSHFPLHVHRCARLACDVERRQRRDPAGRHQGHGSGCLFAVISGPTRPTFRRVRDWPPCNFTCATAARCGRHWAPVESPSPCAWTRPIVAPQSRHGRDARVRVARSDAGTCRQRVRQRHARDVGLLSR